MLPPGLYYCAIYYALLTGITEEEMRDSAAATDLSQKMDIFLSRHQLGYQLEEIKEHALCFKVFFGRRGQEISVDLLLSPYYADQKALLDSLSEYKLAVERQRRPDQWKGIVQT